MSNRPIMTSLSFATLLLAGCPGTDIAPDMTSTTTDPSAATEEPTVCSADDECRKDSQCGSGSSCVDCECVPTGESSADTSAGSLTGSDPSGDPTGNDGSSSDTGNPMVCTADDVCMAQSDCVDGGTCTSCTCVGTTCSADSECQSNSCFVLGVLGGVCSQCKTDADCADITGGGCDLPVPLTDPPLGALCNLGQPGDGCMSDAVCQQGVCAPLYDVPGVITSSTCSECKDDGGCSLGNVCSPTYDLIDLSGTRSCVPEGSVASGEFCDVQGSGDDACASGHCAGANVMGLLELGVCSACSDDADCAGQTCNPPEVGFDGSVTPGACG